MHANTRAAIDSDIRAAVLAQGFADASIVRQTLPNRHGYEFQDGLWFVLFVRYRDGAPLECWGRRRTLAELLTMAVRGPLF